MRKLLTLFAVLIFSAVVCAQTKYKTCTNARFSYSVLYPSDLLKPKKEWDATNSGEIFLSKDKSAEMRVWGEFNALFRTVGEQFDETVKDYGAGVTYRALLKNGFVVSGIKNDKIFYQKTLYHKFENIDVFYTFTIEYKKTDRRKFDSIIKKVADSFKFDPNAKP